MRTVPADVLLDPDHRVPSPGSGTSALDRLRSSAVRFCDGPEHTRRRRLVEQLISGIELRPVPGEHPVATLARALLGTVDARLVPDVERVVAAYHPHLPQTGEAEGAAGRLLDACGGQTEDAAARACLLVQAAAGLTSPRTTRRVAPDGEEVLVDLTGAPYGAGPHACPGRALARVLGRGLQRARFAALHERLLVLPNAWDVASAAALHAAGSPAVATTSLGVAAGRGLSDATGAAREAVLELAHALDALPCPVSVDLEDGFSDDPDEVAELVASLPAAGVNLEDSTHGALVDPALHAARVAAVARRCPDVFVNARVDTYWLGRQDLEETLRRARAYVEAGADGVFVPGSLQREEIEALVRALPVPVNVLAGTGWSVPELARLGVRRVSTGSLLYRTALQAAVDTARAVRDGQPLGSPLSYADVQRLALDAPTG